MRKELKSSFLFFAILAVILLAAVFKFARSVQAASLTCQDICAQVHQGRDGACLTGPKPELGYISNAELVKGARYCPREGESCYCRNNRPVLGGSFPILELELNHRQHIDNLFASSNYDTISEYDAKKLVCRAEIFEQDKEDIDWIIEHPPKFYLLARKTVNEDFKKLAAIQSINSGAVCEQDKNRPSWILCHANVPPAVAKKVERGMLLGCEVRPEDPYQKGIDEYFTKPNLEFRSENILGVADHLYYFFTEEQEYLRIPLIFDAFLSISSVVTSPVEMKDRTKRLGKAYGDDKRILIPVNLLGWRRDNAFRDAVKKRGVVHSKQKDDKITLISEIHQILHAQAHHLKERYGWKKAGGFVPWFGSDLIFLDNEPGLFSFAHEMGHASRRSRLCDEYKKSFWNLQRLGSAIINFANCPNPFPACCLSGACGIPEKCFGMPYDPDWNYPQPNYKIYFDYSSGVFLNLPKHFSVMGDVEVRAKGVTIYPIQAQCPLRNCK